MQEKTCSAGEKFEFAWESATWQHQWLFQNPEFQTALSRLSVTISNSSLPQTTLSILVTLGAYIDEVE